MPLASPRYPFTESAVAGAPDDPGIYALYEGDRLLCIGAALALGNDDTIRARLLAHLRSPKGAGGTTHYKWEITRVPLQRRHEYLQRLQRATLRCEDATFGPPGDL